MICHSCNRESETLPSIREHNYQAGALIAICTACLKDLDASMKHERKIVTDPKQWDLFGGIK